MMLSDMRDYVATLGIAEHVYMEKLPSKLDKSIGVYNSKHQYPYQRSLGDKATYGIKHVTLLVHWNRSPRDTEAVTEDLFSALCKTRDAHINDTIIKFIQPLYEPQPVGTDEDGVYESVLELAVVYAK